jgi:hypothetical protein
MKCDVLNCQAAAVVEISRLRRFKAVLLYGQHAKAMPKHYHLYRFQEEVPA